MRKLNVALTVIATATLVACGGGGGGGSATLSGVVRQDRDVPFATPTLVATNAILTDSNSHSQWAVADVFVGSITGAGQDVVVAGRESQTATLHTNSTVSMYSWSGSTLVDVTAQWFGSNNVIRGTEPSVKVADFNGNGNGIFIAPSTDDQTNTNAYVTIFSKAASNSTSFTRTDIQVGNVWAHDSAVADLNGDGKKDFVLTDYGNSTKGYNFTVGINTTAGATPAFNVVKQDQANIGVYGASGVAVADFTHQNGGGAMQIALSDANGNTPLKVFDWNINGANYLVMTENAITGATPVQGRFTTEAKWASLRATYSNPATINHTVRIRAFDFDGTSGDGWMDVIAFTRPNWTGTEWPKYSEIQFLKNNAGVNFTDVTDTMLYNYNTATAVTYNPNFADFNGDGLTDILVAGQDFSGNNSAQLIIKRQDGTYLATAQQVFTDYNAQMATIANAPNMGTALNLVQDPTSKLYIVGYIQYDSGSGTRKGSVYLSAVGSPTAVQSINYITGAWPYISPATANQALASTSTASYLNGASIIDLEAAMQPIGEIGLPLQGRLGTLTQLNGYITGVKMSANDTKVAVVDSLRRDYQVDMASTVVQGESANVWGLNTAVQGDESYTSQSASLVGGAGASIYGAQLSSDEKNYSIGGPMMRLGKNTMLNVQYTSLNFNPWLSMAGAWGTVKGTGTTELVSTYRENGYSAQLGLMHTATNITPGLVTRVNDIYGMWAEGGYSTKNFSVHAGIKPVMVSGSVDVHMPTSVDANGVVQYTDKTFGLQSYVNGYVRANYTHNISKTVSMNYSGIAIDNGQYRAMAVLKIGM